MKQSLFKRFLAKVTLLATLTLLACSSSLAITIDQQPLLVAKPVPGNMAIVGSFEFPTMLTRAYKDNYSSNKNYIGYFDSEKCYEYHYDKNNEEKRHFYPVNFNGPSCTGSKQWSGNFLNWSTMQSIDIFRHILTGGRRSSETASETILEKGVQTAQSGTNEASLSGESTVKAATALTWSSLKTNIGFGNRVMGTKMYFSRSGALNTNSTTVYDPSKSVDSSKVYEVSIRVKVCEADKLEDNCQRYPNGNYKPTGLIQEYSDTMRYSAFGYLNDSSDNQTYGSNRNRKGGVMHARMKYVGPTSISPTTNTEINNINKEWDPNTGVLIENPDPVDATATEATQPGASVTQSGVISYINNSGHIIPNTKFKRFDNVSELFYTAYRYLRGMPNIAAYTDTSSESQASRNKLVGGLPVISNWKNSESDPERPIQYSCQKNFFLGIGDTNTHNDGNVASDATDDTLFSTNRFTKMRTAMHNIENGEGYTVNVSGSWKTDHIAVFAYDANTNDLLPDLPGKQTASTYWIDVLENDELKHRQNNAYWLAAKYGGFKVPEVFNPETATSIPESTWWTSGKKLSTNDKQPDNFYEVSSAEGMVKSLTEAFANIQLEQRGNRSSLALNSTQLEADSMAFQAQYVSGAWTGNLYGYEINPTTGALNAEAKWGAEEKLPAWDSRNVKMNDGGTLKSFKTDGKNQTGFTQDKVDYLLGKRTGETAGTFRTRTGILGDIINSQPVYAASPRPNLFSKREFTGSSTYPSWANSDPIKNRTPVVYVGGNDGMLHGFNANTGVEIFAFIPKTVFANGLSELVDKTYDHRYFVDGELTIADVYIGGSWKTVLVGTLGTGGVSKTRNTTNNAVFALNITDPNDIKLMWEINSADISALGINIGKPVIAQVADKKWRVLLGNGPNNSNSSAHLISINISDGTHDAFEVSTANGLASVRAWDSNGDGFADTVYAGDMSGALWKISDLDSINPDKKKLFSAKDPSGVAQPITATPLVGTSPYDKTTWIFFGTGRYLNGTDLTDKQIQSWYGIKDNDQNNSLRSNLLERKILVEAQIDTGTNDSRFARVIEEGTREELANKQGWFIDLVKVSQSGTRQAMGERMITQNQFQGSALISNTRIPDASDPCAPSGVGMIMSINPFTGGRLADNYFDVNNDGTIGNGDLIEVNGVKVPASGIGFGTGFSNPSFLGDQMYVPSDDGSIINVAIKPYSSIVGRTSWRELLNIED